MLVREGRTSAIVLGPLKNSCGHLIALVLGPRRGLQGIGWEALGNEVLGRHGARKQKGPEVGRLKAANERGSKVRRMLSAKWDRRGKKQSARRRKPTHLASLLKLVRGVRGRRSAIVAIPASGGGSPASAQSDRRAR